MKDTSAPKIKRPKKQGQTVTKYKPNDPSKDSLTRFQAPIIPEVMSKKIREKDIFEMMGATRKKRKIK